jgi:hypothetical protein
MKELLRPCVVYSDSRAFLYQNSDFSRLFPKISHNFQDFQHLGAPEMPQTPKTQEKSEKSGNFGNFSKFREQIKKIQEKLIFDRFLRFLWFWECSHLKEH